MAQNYDKWKALIAGEKVDLHIDQPELGYYFIRRRNVRVPVAFYPAGKEGRTAPMLCFVGSRAKGRPEEPINVWPEALSNPIPNDQWKHAFEKGSWPDEDLPPQPGDNNPPENTEIDSQVERLEELTRDLLNEEVDAKVADRMANLKDQAVKLQKEMEVDYDADAKEPKEWLARVRGFWKPRQDRIGIVITKLRTKITVWQETEERRAQKAAQEAVEAGTPVEEVSVPKISSGGSTGRKTTMRTGWVAEITDYDLLVEALKNQDKVKELIQKLANASARSGVELPGMKKVRKRKAV